MFENEIVRHSKKLFIDYSYWKSHDILEKEIISSKIGKGIFWLCIIILSVWPEITLSNDFLGYIMAALSIFIGLLINVVTNLYSLNLNERIEYNSKDIKTEGDIKNRKRRENFTMRFNTFSMFAIFLSICGIALMAIGFIIPQAIEPMPKNFINNFWALQGCWDKVIYICLAVGSTFVRLLIFYTLAKIYTTLLYCISTLHTFLKTMSTGKA
jgi:hypothetical protein